MERDKLAHGADERGVPGRLCTGEATLAPATWWWWWRVGEWGRVVVRRRLTAGHDYVGHGCVVLASRGDVSAGLWTRALSRLAALRLLFLILSCWQCRPRLVVLSSLVEAALGQLVGVGLGASTVMVTARASDLPDPVAV